MINCVVTVDAVIVDPVTVDVTVNEFNDNWDKVNVDVSVIVTALIFDPNNVENNTVETVNVELIFSLFMIELAAITVEPSNVEYASVFVLIVEPIAVEYVINIEFIVDVSSVEVVIVELVVIVLTDTSLPLAVINFKSSVLNVPVFASITVIVHPDAVEKNKFLTLRVDANPTFILFDPVTVKLPLIVVSGVIISILSWVLILSVLAESVSVCVGSIIGSIGLIDEIPNE